MKLSIITPTHDVKYLKELEDTILSQYYGNWEWIVVLNNGAQYESSDARIKVFRSPFETESVGKLKKYACSLATGEICVEVDHDDLITPDCLAEIAKAFESPEIGFVYSDDAKLPMNSIFTPYLVEYGWTWRWFEWMGKKLHAMNSQPLYPGRLGYIWFAPDHVRAWRKSVYDSIGGHNEELVVCDDQDLMHRLYLVTKFHFIPKVLYIYRISGNNTWLKKNQLIQDLNMQIYGKNIYKLAERFADLNGLMKIDLCGGINKPAGYISIDKSQGDILADLENGIPLRDNSVGVIRAHDALEHIRGSQQLMSEIHRVLAPGGLLLSLTPSTDGRGAFQDPTHVSFWNENSFWYYTRANKARYINNKKMFRECSLRTYFPDDFCKKNNIPYVEAHLEKLPVNN